MKYRVSRSRNVRLCFSGFYLRTFGSEAIVEPGEIQKRQAITITVGVAGLFGSFERRGDVQYYLNPRSYVEYWPFGLLVGVLGYCFTYLRGSGRGNDL